MPTYVVTGPGGKKYRVTAPAGASEADVMARVRGQSSRPADNSRTRGFIGGVLKPVDNLATWLSEVPVVGPALDDLGEAVGLPSTKQAVAKNNRARKRNTRTGWQTIGNIAGTLPTAYLPGGVMAQGAAAGALLTEDPTDAKGVMRDATIGAVTGKAGDVVGRKVAAPAVRAVARTKPVRTIADLGRKAAGKAATPVRNVTQKAVSSMAPNVKAVRDRIAQADEMGLPYALADADPKLRVLGGSVSRQSPTGREIAEQTFGPRALGQADRAVNNIDEMLAPVTDIEQRAADIRKAAQDASRPFYDEARAMAAPSDDELAGYLRTPAGKKALREAYDIAANEGKDPAQLGFVMDDAGGVSLRQMQANEAGRFARPQMTDPRTELTRSTVRGWNGSEVPKVGPTDLVGWIRQQGGLQNQGDELRHMGLTNAARKMDFAGQEQRFGPLVNDMGMNLDDASLRAWEAGYFPEHADRPDVNTFLNALRDTYEGRNRRFLPSDLDQIDRFGAVNAEREAMREARFTGASMVDDMSSPAGPREFPPIEAYNPQYDENPTFETLQLVKRALDSQLEPARNPISGKLMLEGRPDLQSIAGLKDRLNSRMAALNEPYKQGNAAYADVIRRRDALNLGQDVARGGVPQRQFDTALERMDEVTLPEMQRGYATNMADTVNRMRMSGDPYKAVYGSPDQQAKVNALFPEGAERFNRLFDLEGDMSKTAYETIGGSPTAARTAADQIFQGGVPTQIAATGMDMMTGSPSMSMLRLAARKIGDYSRTGGERRAAEMAPALFNTDTKATLAYLDELLRINAAMEAEKAAYAQAGRLLALPAAAATVSGAQ